MKFCSPYKRWSFCMLVLSFIWFYRSAFYSINAFYLTRTFNGEDAKYGVLGSYWWVLLLLPFLGLLKHWIQNSSPSHCWWSKCMCIINLNWLIFLMNLWYVISMWKLNFPNLFSTWIFKLRKMLSVQQLMSCQKCILSIFSTD